MEVEVFDETGSLSVEDRALIENILNFSADYLDLSENTEVSVTLVDNYRIREINNEYRNKNYATDVISFAMDDTHEDDMFGEISFNEEIEFPHILGDLFISLDKMKEQAEEYGHSEKREMGFLTVHGFLHLNGYDHMTDKEEKEMFGIQEKILGEFGLTR